MTTNISRALIVLVISIVVVVGGYYVLQPKSANAPVVPAQTTPVETSDQSTTEKPPANVGAAGVYDPNAPAGSAAQCAECDQYTGSQKAQCLVALKC